MLLSVASTFKVVPLYNNEVSLARLHGLYAPYSNVVKERKREIIGQQHLFLLDMLG